MNFQEAVSKALNGERVEYIVSEDENAIELLAIAKSQLVECDFEFGLRKSIGHKIVLLPVK